VARPSLEVADIFRGHGAAWRDANRGHLSLDQLKVMSAIENCRTAALGGHVARCEDCAHTVIAYNSCRNRHCPKCQGAAARAWMAARETERQPYIVTIADDFLTDEQIDEVLAIGLRQEQIEEVTGRSSSLTVRAVAAEYGSPVGLSAGRTFAGYGRARS
jgi:Transposase zinc-binding domain